ncbi:MAG: tetratricopeptide repeat protein, partial [Halothiobacillaceae bacterium]|nr:tetratricopeptide repeat protein [Halothiobacillaceae bacterium]
MKLKSLFLLTPLCTVTAQAAPEIRPLDNPVQQMALPSAAESSTPLPTAIESTQIITRPTQHEALPSATPAQPLQPRLQSVEPIILIPAAEPDAPITPAPSPSAATPTPPRSEKPARASRAASAPKTVSTPRPSANANANVRDASEAATSAKAIELYEAKDYKGAIVLLKETLPFYIRTQDAGMVSLVGFAALEAGENQLALDSFRQAAEWTDDEEFWLVLVDAHLRLEQPEEAQKILDGLPKSKERDQRIDALLGARASKAFESGQYTLAEKMLLEAKAPLGAANLE